MSEKKGPYKKSKSGRFQVSLFKFEKLIRKGDTIRSELIVDNFRVCIQYSTFSKKYNNWQRQQIWCSPEELRDLGNAISGLTE